MATFFARIRFSQVILGVCFLSFLFIVTGCKKDVISEDGFQNDPTLASAIIPADIMCGSIETVGFRSESGSPYINFCSYGPCQTTLPWGSFSFLKGVDSSWTNPRISGEFILSAGWFASEAAFNVGLPSSTVTSNNLPVIGSSFQTTNYNVSLGRGNLIFPLPNSWIPQRCYEITLRLRVFRLNIFNQVNQASVRNIYATTNTSELSGMFVNHCFERCIPPTTTMSRGDCRNCHARIDVTFNGCESVDVSSCKHINHVVIVYDDCTWERITNPSGTLPAPGGNGKTISHIYVKSGCNVSQQGPGFGERFDGPCENIACGTTF